MVCEALLFSGQIETQHLQDLKETLGTEGTETNKCYLMLLVNVQG